MYKEHDTRYGCFAPVHGACYVWQSAKSPSRKSRVRSSIAAGRGRSVAMGPDSGSFQGLGILGVFGIVWFSSEGCLVGVALGCQLVPL